MRKIKNNEVVAIGYEGKEVFLVNTTPHPITMQSPDGTVFTLGNDPSYLLNARAESVDLGEGLCKTVFHGTPEGNEIILRILHDAEIFAPGIPVRIIGSMIAAQAYPGNVCAMCPVPGFERVAPAEKRMRTDMFTVFE